MSELAISKVTEWREHPAKMVRELFGVEPDPWQEEMLEAYPHKLRIAAKACKGPGKMEAMSTIVETPVGTKRWGDLYLGDYLFAEDGSYTKIVGIYKHLQKQIYKVTFDDGSFARVGAEHLWKVQGRTERRKNLGWAVLSTQEIINRGVTIPNGKWRQKQFIIPQQGAVQYPNANLIIDPYLMGVWLGDGTKGQPKYTQEYDEIEKEIVRRGYKVTRHESETRTTNVYLLGMSDIFKNSPILNLNSHERRIPYSYLHSSISQRQDLLCGLMDTDGCICDDSSMEYDTTSEALANDVVWLVRSLGGIALIKSGIKSGWYRNENGEKIVCKDCYRVSLRLTFNPFKVNHKAVRWVDPKRSKSTERYLTRFIASIEPDGIEDAMCVEIDHPSHCYLTRDFIVTHNTACLSWIAWNFLLTRPFPRIAATSISANNLSDNFWSEMAKWQHKSELLTNMFTWTKTRIEQKEHPEIWWMSARTWSKTADKQQQSDTLAGLHEDYVMVLLDESSGIPDAIVTTAEQILTSCIEGHVIQAGNPTMREGPLYRACTSERHLWYVVEITGDPDDPKRSSRINLDHAKTEIARYGRDDAWVMINILGQFPLSSINALIGPEEIREATNRYYREYEIGKAPMILGVDVARYGLDSSVIFPRRGIQAFPPKTMRNINSTEGASWVNREWLALNADAVFIDDTGGFGSGWIDQLKVLGRSPIGVGYARKAHDPGKFGNKRAEMYYDAVEWIKAGGALPECKELEEALTATTYTIKNGILLIEPKEMIKEKLRYSPDHADAFIQTFAEPVTISQRVNRLSRHTTEYDPFAKINEGHYHYNDTVN
jgi:hypothetical protein